MRRLTSGAVLAITILTAPATAQQSGHPADHDGMHGPAPTEGLRAELIGSVDQLEQKYLALAHAMTDHLDWRPAEGVRSAGEVFGHVANANFMIPSMAGAEREMSDRNFEQVTDPAALIDALEHSFMHARHSIAGIPDSELDDGVTMFGQQATKRQVLTVLVTHMHEHLGQAIAYARTNGVTPPWSGGD